MNDMRWTAVPPQSGKRLGLSNTTWVACNIHLPLLLWPLGCVCLQYILCGREFRQEEPSKSVLYQWEAGPCEFIVFKLLVIVGQLTEHGPHCELAKPGFSPKNNHAHGAGVFSLGLNQESKTGLLQWAFLCCLWHLKILRNVRIKMVEGDYFRYYQKIFYKYLQKENVTEHHDHSIFITSSCGRIQIFR